MGHEGKEREGIKILHVDDESDFLALTKTFLEREHGDFQVDTAPSAEEGLELLRLGTYDVVVSDYQMPVMDGLIFLQTLRERGDTIPFIIFTGKGREEVAIEALNRGADHYIQKGGEIESLYGTLAHTIRQEVEKTRAETAVKEERYRAQQYLDIARVIIVALDTEGTVTLVNKRGCEVLGSSSEEIIGKNWFETFLPKGIVDEIKVVFSKLIAGEVEPVEYFENPVLTKSGEERTIAWHNTILRDETGITGILSSGEDITERKQAEEKLRESEERYRTFINSTADMVFLKDDQFKHVIVNKALVDFFEKNDEEELFGKTDFELMPEPAATKCRESDMKSLELGTVVITEELIGDRVYETRKFPVLLGDHKIGVGGYVREITAQKRVEEAFRESEENFRGIAERSFDTIFTLDLHGQITYISPAVKRVMGYTPAEAKEKTFYDFLSESEDAEIKEIFAEVIREGTSVDGIEIEAFKKDGTLAYIELNISPIIKGKVIVGLQGNARDVTDRKQAEAALKASENEYRTIFETTGAAVAIIEDDMTISRVNRDFERLIGYSKEEVEGKKKWPEFVVDADAEQMKTYHRLRRVDTAAAPKSYEFQFIDKQGTVKDALLAIDMIPGTKRSVASLIDITTQKQAVKALRASEEHFKGIAERSFDVIFTFDLEGRITYVSPATTWVMGCTPEAMRGRFFREFQPESELERANEIFTKVMKEGMRLEGIEIPVLRCDGAPAYIEVNASPIWEGDDVVGLQGNARDITERKKAEETLKKSEERYRLLAENVSDELWIAEVPSLLDVIHALKTGKDLDTNAIASELRINFTYVSPSIQKMQGWTPEEYMRLDFKTTVCPDSYKTLIGVLMEELMNEAKEEGALDRSRTLEVETIRKDGSTYWVETKVTFLRDTANNPVAILGVSRDITERKQAEAALRESEEKWRSLVENVPDGIVVTDATGIIVQSNTAAAETHGYDAPEDLIGKPFFSFVAKREHQRIADTFEGFKSKRGMTLKNFGVTGVRKDGSEFPLLFHIYGLRDNEGNLISTTAVGRDITELKRAEEELRKKTAFLEAQVESSLDGILIVDSNNQRILTTQRFLDLLQVPQHIIDDEDDTALLQFAVSKTKHPEQFLRKIEYLYAHKTETSRDEIEFKDGLFLDRYSAPVFGPEGDYYGRIWYFRDITEQKQIEETRRKYTEDLKRFNRIAVDREMRMIELKQEVNQAYERLGEAPPYDLSFVDASTEDSNKGTNKPE